MDDDDDDNDYLRYSDSIEFQHRVEQQNDEMITSVLNSASIDTNFSQEETPNFTLDRRRVLVDFVYSLDNDRLLPMTQTTVIKSEPYFKVIATEDEVTKHFYANKSPSMPREHRIKSSIKQRIPSEADSLEEEYTLKDKPSSSSIKSILKKSPKKEEEANLSMPFRPLSPSAKKKETSSTRLDFNEVQHLAEITAKQRSSPTFGHPRSLFNQTINIFDPNNSREIPSNRSRPSRLQYYIKPYRGEANAPTNAAKQRSRSLSRNRLMQSPSSTIRSQTLSNSYVRQSSGKQRVSWSPVREYIPGRQEHKLVTPTKKKEISLDRTNSSPSLTTLTLSLNGIYIPNSSPIISIPIHYRKSQSTQFPSPPPPRLSSSIDSYYTPTMTDRPLQSIVPNHYKKETLLKSSLIDTEYQDKKEHSVTMQRYDQLLEKIRVTDKELQSLSRSWTTNNKQQRIPIRVQERGSNVLLNRTTHDHSQFCSPMILQICLIILVIVNLLVVYYFNEINDWWSEHITPALTRIQSDEENFDL